jgi:two-component system, NtrC family, nitrogen regulation sensor histidine kinase NtrY
MKNFSLNILVRTVLLTSSVLLVGWLIWVEKRTTLGTVLGVGLVGLQTYLLYQYATTINRKLSRLFESIRYSDFAIKFRSDDQRGDSFRELNQQFNEVLEAFRAARAEKEANLQYLNTIVQQINTGLISLSHDGRVELVNSAALKMLGVYRLRQLSDIAEVHPLLADIIQKQTSGGRELYETPDETPLAVQITPIQLRGKSFRIIALQNIQSELQQKEIEAWQNLTRVLRHEIMNSLTPILSLVGTMRDIVNLDIVPVIPENEGVQDLSEALQTLEKRSQGIIQFVNAYRDFTTLPKPVFVQLRAKELFGRVLQLFQTNLQNHHIELVTSILPENLSFEADADQMEQVLINLVKNAIEALQESKNPQLNVKAYSDMNGRVYMEVADNGAGIAPEAIEKIFIPFYTTKKTGSGIGLSLSRQIVQQHGGTLTVTSEEKKGTTFVVVL